MLKARKLPLNIAVMKRLFGVIAWTIILGACQETETDLQDFTGNEATYPLQAGSDYAVYGHITFKERRDGSAQAIVQLTGTGGNMLHPVHLHLGDISEPGTEIAVLLNPVQAATGRSETIINRLSDETPITYSGILALYASIKVHLSESGPERDIILAGGNIGQAYMQANGRRVMEMAICKSE